MDTAFSLMETCQRQFFHKESGRRTVYSAMIEDPYGTSSRIISMACGMKCLPALRDTKTQERLPTYRQLVRDMHAEVLCRRALIRYVLNGGEVIGPVYLFTTKVPCGDASIVAESEAVILSECRLMRGKMGWSSLGCPRTKPGRADAPDTECMSCTDKIKLWCRLGVQGKLITTKIPLAGIVVGGRELLEQEKASVLRNFPNAQFHDSLCPDEALTPSFEAQAWHVGMAKAERLTQGRKFGSLKGTENAIPRASRSLFCDDSLNDLSLLINEEYVREKKELLSSDPYFRHYLKSP